MIPSSNQVFKISGILDIDDIEEMLTFALRFFNCNEDDMFAIQKTNNSEFCIGWVPSEGIPEPWEELKESKTDNVYRQLAIEVCQYFYNMSEKKFHFEFFNGCDGDLRKGILMENLHYYDENVKHAAYGIIKISPLAIYYAK